jgi:uncharacterized membrane protein YozB (DUF420 family)
MANVWARDREAPFYLGIGLVGLAAIAIGFSTTYVLPMARRTFEAPIVVHVHGALCLAWITLVIAQASLVKSRRTPLHRRLGWIAAPIALGMLATGIAVALRAARRDIPSQGLAAASPILGVVTTLVLFVLLVGLALAWRRYPDWHKRLILLATILVLWPAWFRFRHLLPWVPRPEVWLALVLADLPIAVAALRDRLKYGAIHPVWLYFGSALFVEQCFEINAFDSPPWRATGEWLFRTLAT